MYDLLLLVIQTTQALEYFTFSILFGRYLGHLENEPSACIAMVGCPGVEKVEFTIFSKNVFDSPAYIWTKEGSVEMIETDVSQKPKPLFWFRPKPNTKVLSFRLGWLLNCFNY